MNDTLQRKEELVDSILNMELSQFLSVKADAVYACQQETDSFLLYRKAQFDAWDNETLTSYLDDLHKAELDGINLMTMKYAYMDGQLGIPKDNMLVYSIVDQLFQWQQDLFRQYPILQEGARSLEHDSDETTSFKTYLIAELSTYSDTTLQKFRQHMMQLASESKNMSEMIYHNILKAHGIPSIEVYLASRSGL